MVAASLLALLPLLGLARAHGSMWHNSMFGFNVTATNSPQYGSRDNRPQAPLKNLPFDQWWFHGHLDQPPHPNDIMELPAGDKVTIELACDKGATSFWPSAPGGNQQNGNDPCPGPPSQLIHTNGIDDLGGCALAIAYKSDANQVRPEDFVVFSINHRCIWDRFTDFQIPANMPECPNGKCTCAWFWHHREDAGGDEMYMNGFQCKITGAKATTPIPKGQVPARCVDDKSKCVKGAKQPFYWDQAEGNNMFEDIYHPPLYLDTYGFADGAQNDIWDTVGGSSGPAQKSSSSSSSSSTSTTAPASTSPAAATTTSAATSTSAQVPDNVATTSTSSAPTTTPAAPQGGANVQDANTVSTSAPTSTTTAAAQQGGGNVQNGTTSSTSAPATRIQGGQGHRTCRPKKTKRSLRRHARRSRVF